MTKWEYRTFRCGACMTQSALDNLGEGGWELATVTVGKDYYGSEDFNYIFKRPKS